MGKKAAPKKGATTEKVPEKVRKSALKGANAVTPKNAHVQFQLERKKPEKPTGDKAIMEAIQKQKGNQAEPKKTGKLQSNRRPCLASRHQKQRLTSQRLGGSEKAPVPPKAPAGLVTPPAKRLTMKSPAASTTSSTRSSAAGESGKTRTAGELAAAKERAEKALLERQDLQLAAKRAEDTAALDAAGMTDFLDSLGSDADPRHLLQKYQQQKKDLQDKKRQEETGEETDDQEEEGDMEEGEEEAGQEDKEEDEECDDAEMQEKPSEGDKPEMEEEQGEEEEEEEEEMQEDDIEDNQNEADEDQLALAVATTTKQSARQEVRNSTTHKKEWDRFARQCANKSVFPVTLAGAYKRPKTDLFAAWLDSGMSWERTEVLIQRRQDSKNLARRQMTGIQAKTLKEKLGEEKANRIITLRKDQGLYYQDDDFPDDPEDRENLKQKNG